MVLWPTVDVVGAGTVLAGRLALRARRAPPITGDTGMIGQHTVVDEAEGPNRRAQVEGAWWNLRGHDQPLHRGQRVRVVDADGLTLIVEAVAQEEK
ncbi:NfeD family protein [Nocardia sp. NPDC050710]|uniref:NfeD family protein n=1 Tax=Nocardia sp. NPDC050710 TaxID=3157220 RepID=UPI0033F29425